MSITYEHKYDVTYIYNKFKKNRVNAVSYLGTSNNGKLEPDSSAYLSYENLYVNNYTYTYIYARKSSPTIDDDTDKNYAYLKVGDTTYNLYHSHAYTYTETVTGNGVKPILIAYDFVNKISTYLEFKDVSISHNASPINDVPQTANVFSPVSYIIENGEKSLNPKNEYSISSSNINTLLNGKTFADFTTYVTYSYLNSEKGDGIVYEDGKDTLSTNPINDIHIWSLSDGVDMSPHKYVNNDTSAVNAYTYLNCGNILNTFFRNNVSNIFDYNSINYKYIKFYYDISVSNTNGVLQQWTAGIVGTDKIYAKDVRTGDNILDYSTFYKVCKVDLPNVSSFNEIYNKPSLRNNSDEINCYININGNSFPGDQEIAYIDKSNNTNKARFVKKINNLPISIVGNSPSNTQSNKWFWKFNLPEASNQSGTLPKLASRAGSVNGNTGGITVEANINIYSGGKFTQDTKNKDKLILSYNEADSIKIKISMTFETENDGLISDYSTASLGYIGSSEYVKLEQDNRNYTVYFKEKFINKSFNVIHIQQPRTEYEQNKIGHTACINIGHPNNENIWYTTANTTDRDMYDLLHSNSSGTSNIKVDYGGNEYNVTWGFPFYGGENNIITCQAHIIN